MEIHEKSQNCNNGVIPLHPFKYWQYSKPNAFFTSIHWPMATRVPMQKRMGPCLSPTLGSVNQSTGERWRGPTLPSRKTNGLLFLLFLVISVVTIDERGHKAWLLDPTCRLSVNLSNPSKHYTRKPALFADAITRQTLISCVLFE